MRIKKVMMKSLFLLASVPLLLISCNGVFFSDPRNDLLDLAAFSAGLDAMMRTTAASGDPDPEADSRTVNPRPEPYIASDNQEITIYSTPLETYHELGGNGNNTVHVPGSAGYLKAWYGNPALNASFSMQPHKDEYFKIKLHVYDTADFFLNFVYEEYLVHNDSWAFLTESYQPGFISYYDRMTDGSRINHLSWESTDWESGDTNVYNITVPVIHEELSAYTFTIRDDWIEPSMFESETVIPEIERNVDGDFFIYKESTGNYRSTTASRSADYKRPDYEAKSFYAERQGQDDRSMAVFSLQNIAKNRGNVARTVTRSREEYDGHSFISKQLRSLTAFSYRDSNPWQHITREFNQTLENTLTAVQHTEGVYWGGSEVDGDPDRITTMELLQNSPGSSDYSGTMEITWKNSSWTETYDVTFNGRNFRIRSTGGYNSSSRFLNNSSSSGREINFDLEKADSGTEFSLILSSGSIFTGFWEFGILTGTLTKMNGEVLDIEVYGGAVLVDGEPWTAVP